MSALDTARAADDLRQTMDRDAAAATILVDKPSWSSANPPSPSSRPTTGADHHRVRLTTRRRRIGLAVAAMVGLAVIDPFLGSIQHQQRQEHLVVAFGEPKQKIAAGDALFVLQIPSIEFSQVVIEGATSGELRSGPGHVIGTSVPGAKGNTVILGHASRYGGPFSEIRTLTEGARIALKSRSGFVQLYKVTSTKKVSDSDDSALRPTKGEQLTLVTSEDAWLPGKRIVVTAAPDVEAAAPPAIAVKAPEYAPASGALDDTSLDLRALALVAALVALIALGGRRLSSKYRRGTIIVLVVPAIALVAISILHLADVLGPATW